MASQIPTGILVGVGGFGQHHLTNLHRLSMLGKVRLTGLVSPEGAGPVQTHDSPEVAAWAAGIPLYPSVETALRSGAAPGIAVISSPIHTHTALALMALRAGSHLLLEKPPVPSAEEFELLQAVAESCDRIVQVGFQSFGSHALSWLAELVRSGAIGQVRAVGGVGTWSRSQDYFARSGWAGRRALDGLPVVDGVVTNPLAHAVATALKIAGATTKDQVRSVTVDLYRANAIECDDTSAVRVITESGIPVTLGLTLTAAAESPPRVVLQASRGTATLWYTSDTVELDLDGASTTTTFGRTDLTENLLDHLADPATPLLCPLADTGAFTRVLEAVRTAPAPRRIPKQYLAWAERDGTRWAIVERVEDWCEQVAATSSTFDELGAPWSAPKHRTIAEIIVDGHPVGRYLDGGGADRLDGPRPHFHPLTTLAGTVVTDDSPPDHSWHAGLGWGIPDVARQDEPGNNLWGGRTYLRDRGYVMLDDHGRIEHRSWRAETNGGTQGCLWRDRDDQVLLRETRRLRWLGLDESAWALRVETTLQTPDDRVVRLGSPGSNGRTGGGYGGFFWRLPEACQAEPRTMSQRGEAGVHGTTAPWLAWSATDPATGHRYTVAFSGDDAASLADPYFVRVADYPGIGSAIAWDRPTSVLPGVGLHRSFTAVIADGGLTDEAIPAYLAQARQRWGHPG